MSLFRQGQNQAVVRFSTAGSFLFAGAAEGQTLEMWGWREMERDGEDGGDGGGWRLWLVALHKCPGIPMHCGVSRFKVHCPVDPSQRKQQSPKVLLLALRATTQGRHHLHTACSLHTAFNPCRLKSIILAETIRSPAISVVILFVNAKREMLSRSIGPAAERIPDAGRVKSCVWRADRGSKQGQSQGAHRYHHSKASQLQRL